MTDIVETLKNIPPRDVCEHGSQRVKCPICELAEAETEIEKCAQRIAELEAALRTIDDLRDRREPPHVLFFAARMVARAALGRDVPQSL